MRGHLLKRTAVTCAPTPGVIKNGRPRVLVSPVLAKETGVPLMKLEVEAKGWFGVTGDPSDIRITAGPRSQLLTRAK